MNIIRIKSKTKVEALRIIHNCALSYNNNLVHKNVLFITIHANTASCFEVAFLPRNFLHLTGVKTKLSSVDFFNLAVRDRLSENDFQLTADGITDIKLEILSSLMNIHTSARMVGDYDNSRTLLVTDKFAGTVTSAMGFRKTGDIYVPNTALNTDMRDVTKKPVHRVAAIFIKDKKKQKYCEMTYIAKGLTIDDDVIKSILTGKTDYDNITAKFIIPKSQN